MNDADIQTLVCENAYVHASRLFPRDAAIERAKFNSYVQQSVNAIVLDMETYLHAIPAEKIVIKRKWPKTWWDAFKLRWYPAWAKQRWPVEFERIDIEEKRYLAVCPHLQIESQGTHLKWLFKEQQKGGK